MARPPKSKALCFHCEQRMGVGEAFCPSCGRPSIWASHEDRVAWEVGQWRAINGEQRTEVYTPVFTPPQQYRERVRHAQIAPILESAVRDEPAPVIRRREEPAPVLQAVTHLEPAHPREPVLLEESAPALEPLPPERHEPILDAPEPGLHLSVVDEDPASVEVDPPALSLKGDDVLTGAIALLEHISDRVESIERHLASLDAAQRRRATARIRRFVKERLLGVDDEERDPAA